MVTTMTVNTYPDLFWAYTAVWTIVAGYIVSLGARLAKLEQFFRAEDRSQTGDARGCDSKR